MTELSYRGVAHTHTGTSHRRPSKYGLSYRGVALQPDEKRRPLPLTVRMFYRAASYTLYRRSRAMVPTAGFIVPTALAEDAAA